MDGKPMAAGKSSFNLIDAGRLFTELSLAKGTALLDLACGSGAYAIAASREIGGQGRVYAVDLWKEGIDALRKEAAGKGITNISAFIADIGKHIPLEDDFIDVCLAATVMHDLVEDGTDQGTLQELKRVLKPGGTLAVIEFKKVQGPPGPPVQIRLAPGELENLVAPYGFYPFKTEEVGLYNYLSLFTISK
jgi:ubiquinone/menaquinone biosynthesis C-methylase UbiE